VIMSVDEWSVVVLVAVVGRAMLELASQDPAAGVVMGHVVVVVGVDLGRVHVLLLAGALPDRRLLRRCRGLVRHV
jgi:divalent metal cation (Fe/Co/Zn/Cd) transporter